MITSDRPRLVVVTNIPSPYRLHEFRVLHEVLQVQGINFEAIFLATTETGRHWQYSPEQAAFPHRIAAGWNMTLRGKPFLFNPGVVAELWHKPPTWLWLGGSWYLPTTLAASWLGRLRGRTRLLGWNESTAFDRHTLSHETGDSLRRQLVRPYHGWVVPGERAAIYAREAYARPGSPILTFANTVDESLYRDRVAALRQDRISLRARWRLGKERVFLWPARLSPEKGILEFLGAIESVTGNYIVLIAGEGPQRPEIEVWLADHPHVSVRLLGHQNIEHLLELYALADVLLLPSLSEPYGFVAVEALWARLPLLLSERVGALPEVLEPGVNGWVIDPAQPETIRQAFEAARRAAPDELVMMGAQSQTLAEKHFDSTHTTQQFVNSLLATLPPRES